jgi:hypothetical protein
MNTPCIEIDEARIGGDLGGMVRWTVEDALLASLDVEADGFAVHARPAGTLAQAAEMGQASAAVLRDAWSATESSVEEATPRRRGDYRCGLSKPEHNFESEQKYQRRNRIFRTFIMRRLRFQIIVADTVAAYSCSIWRTTSFRRSGPLQASEMASCTPLRPRSTRWRRNADQPDLSSLAPWQMPRISRNPIPPS